MSGGRPFQALSHRDFRHYWLGQAVSLTGAWMQVVAQGWVIVGLTGSTATIASIAVVSALPQVALLLHGGVLADRYDRRKLLIATQVGLALLAFLYAALVGSAALRLPHVYALALALGAVLAFDLPAAQALVPQLVPPAAIGDAVALTQAIFHGSRLVGPAIAGGLIAATSPAMAFAANGASYFAVIATLLVIRPRPYASAPGAGGGGAPGAGGGGAPGAGGGGAPGAAAPPSSPVGALGAGLRYVRGDPAVRALIGFTALNAAFLFPWLLLFLPIAVKATFGGDERALGLAMSATGLGAMVGSLGLLKVAPERRATAIVASAAVSALALVGLSFAPGATSAAAILLFYSCAISLSTGLTSTLLQIAIPDGLRGRVLSIQSLCFAALAPGAGLALGLCGESVSMRTMFRVAGIAYAVLALPWLVRARVGRAE